MNTFNFDNVKIKSDSLSVENSIKLNNNTSVTISKDLTFVDYNARIIGDGRTAIHFENDEATYRPENFKTFPFSQKTN